MYHYTKNFVGPAHELIRLKSITTAFINQIRKNAPKFYEERLPQFVNQACSTLLTYETSTHKGSNDFHKCHSTFLCILKSFKQSQPAGEISFQEERTYFEEKTKLKQEYLTLRARIEELEAAELDYDELGEDDTEDDNVYDSIFNELDRLKADLKRVSVEIAHMDGFQIEEEPTFELRVPPRSIMNSLTKEQLKKLEQQMFDLVKANKNERTAMYVDKSIIDSMIEKLDIDLTKFKKEQIKDITKDALDAYKSYFREIDSKNREVFYNDLLTRPSLAPKEGLIISGPDDVPEEIRTKLDTNNQQCKREIEEILESYSKRPCATDHIGDAIDDAEPENDMAKIIESVRAKGVRYERVKEEPRDDCEEYSSGEEQYIDKDLAEAVVDNRDIVYVSISSDSETSDHEGEDKAESAGDGKQVKLEMSGGSDGISNSHDESGQDDDDEIEFLGTIEPTDKIKTFALEE